MTDTSPILGLPYLLPAQAQKHVTVNEALVLLDLLVQAAVSDRTRTVAPGAPVLGDRHIVAAGASGIWAGQDGRIAHYGPAGWEFVIPKAGWLVQILAEARGAVFNGTLWITPDAQAQSFPQVGVSTTADATNRLSVVAPATLLSHAGAGHQLKLNKATAGDTASLLYQTGFSGRAELGLTGDDNLSVKVSPDGSAWTTAVSVTAASGVVTLPAGLRVAAGTAGAPGLAFAADTDTGLTRLVANQLGLVTGGVERVTLSTTALTSAVPVLVPNGTAAAPSVAPSGDTDSGLWSIGVDILGLAAGGAERARITTAGMQVSGLLSGTAVTQSVTDNTTGRLLKVGDFGLGGEGLQVTDLNTVTVNGIYKLGGTATNAPAGITTSSLLVVRFGTLIQQWLFEGASVPRLWMRRSMDSGATWPNAWRVTYTSGNLLGTVSQSGGNPTGAAIERVSNANGTYVRWADGTQICTSIPFTADVTTAAGSGFRSTSLTWTFPAAFSTATGLLAIGSAPNNEATHWVNARALSVTDCNLVLHGWTSQVGRQGSVVAIGRWF